MSQFTIEHVVAFSCSALRRRRGRWFELCRFELIQKISSFHEIFESELGCDQRQWYLLVSVGSEGHGASVRQLVSHAGRAMSSLAQTHAFVMVTKAAMRSLVAK